MLLDQCISQIKATLHSNSYLIKESEVKEYWEKEKPFILVTAKVTNLVGLASDFIQMVRKLRSIVPRQYGLKIAFTTVL